ncbi:recombination protein NinB [Sphingomonas sp. SRS2]|uniref:recombination protein NinB n=1 Tax=Sphingomonas sp. SRS2 TaxID=133190 RepID=UPI00061847E5|nr:recombination protein NinB [Sphingomonas sp. SRS2]KKC25812.1 hypothetical protein WP12_12215 [Sphingomonas sp. SRS2]
MTHTVILRGPAQRALATKLILQAPDNFVVTIKEQTRTSEQSDKMWAMLGDISRAKPLGRRHTPDDWKALAMNACGWECQFQEGLDGRPFPKGFRSSHLTKSQMSTLIEWLYAFGAENGVRWSDQMERAA